MCTCATLHRNRRAATYCTRTQIVGRNPEGSQKGKAHVYMVMFKKQELNEYDLIGATTAHTRRPRFRQHSTLQFLGPSAFMKHPCLCCTPPRSDINGGCTIPHQSTHTRAPQKHNKNIPNLKCIKRRNGEQEGQQARPALTGKNIKIYFYALTHLTLRALSRCTHTFLRLHTRRV